MTAPRVLTVTQLNEYIKMLFDSQPVLSNIYVKGEISNFTDHRSGHWYFTLKDSGGALSAVMFKSAAAKCPFMPEYGMRVIVRGRVSSFVRDGKYQIYVEEMQPDGIGGLYLAYEQLKQKLEAEGLFDPARKRPLPRIPKRVGVITSPTGAAVRDIINITGRRFPCAELVLYPALVQGASAAPSLIDGIRYFSEKKNVDVIIIGRGGGSLEDLWAFNDEGLARAVAASPIPVISAVGHETDFTICDFAADVRAATPSAAAELAVPYIGELRDSLIGTQSYIGVLLRRKLTECKKQLDVCASSRSLRDPSVILNERKMTALHLTELLDRAMNDRLTDKRHRLARAGEKMSALNPISVLTRGYGAVENADGKIILGASELREGDRVRIRFSDGHADAQILRTEINHE